MASIRYVCLSDMHLGEEDSLLTNLNSNGAIDVKKASPVLEQLVKCLRYIISESNKDGTKPTLVLNGDIFELALAEMNTAGMVFDRFLELIDPYGNRLFNDIIYIPGNHDHHFWEIAREDQYVNYIAKKTSRGDDIEPPWHTSNIFMDDPKNIPIPANFIKNLISRLPKPPEKTEFTANVAYPNFGAIKKNIDKSSRCVIFHHGHFIESIYMLMSNVGSLFLPDEKNGDDEFRHIWDIEAENFAWIDFFWSTMGRSGKVGDEVEKVYESLNKKDKRKELLHNLSKNLIKRYGHKGIPDFLESGLLGFLINILNGVAERYVLEKTITDSLLGKDATDGLLKYLNVFVEDRISFERPDMVQYELAFVFGHTHKPYQNVMELNKYQNPVSFYNTGGWIVDTDKAKPLHGGAVILIDDDFNVASIRVYNEAEKRGDYEVKVEKADTADNPLHQQITGLVERPSERALWDGFSETIFVEVDRRLGYIRKRMASSGKE